MLASMLFAGKGVVVSKERKIEMHIPELEGGYDTIHANIDIHTHKTLCHPGLEKNPKSLRDISVRGPCF